MLLVVGLSDSDWNHWLPWISAFRVGLNYITSLQTADLELLSLHYHVIQSLLINLFTHIHTHTHTHTIHTHTLHTHSPHPHTHHTHTPHTHTPHTHTHTTPIHTPHTHHTHTHIQLVLFLWKTLTNTEGKEQSRFVGGGPV